jgi:hypothetical protein
MTRLLILIASIMAIAACNKPKQTSLPSVATTEDTIKRLNIQPDNFIEIDTSGIILFPLSMTETVYDKKRSYKDMPNENSWNILFYNSNTEKYHLLTNEKILISSYYLGVSDEYSDRPVANSSYIFYAARTDDYNRDKLINEDDPVYLFASDRSGNSFRQLSPSGYDLSDWKYFKRSNKVIFTAIVDKNRDSLFKFGEEHLVFENSLDSNSRPRQIFSRSFIDSLKLNFGRYWHRIK